MIVEGLAIVGIIAVAHKVKRWWFQKDEDNPEATRDERDPSDQESHEDK